LRIGELAVRTGVGVPTLRAWESRYRLLRPSRTAGGHRLYSAEDEARIREVQALIAEGVAVGAAARYVGDRHTGDRHREAAASGGAGSRAGNAGSHAGLLAQGDGGRGATVDTLAQPALLAAGEGAAEAKILAAVHETTRAIVHAATPADVVAVLAGFVRGTGASLVHAQIDDAVLPVDLSFGEGPPILPRAEPMSVARMTLEGALPALVEDARRLIDLLRRAGA
jgi:DNA-binding transcriptional MerR regulator